LHGPTDIFENNLGMKNDFTKCFKKYSFVLHVSFKCFLKKKAFLAKLTP